MEYTEEKKRKKKINRKKQLYTRIALFATGVISITWSAAIVWQSSNGREKALMPPRVWTREEGLIHLEECALQNSDYEAVCQQANQLPDNLIGALCNNEEMLSYAKKYASTEKKPYGELTEEEQSGDEIPLLMQWDERWGYAPYGDDVIALSGCGVTSLSMVLVGLTGNEDAAPDDVADYAMEQGFYVPGVGTSWNLMTEGAAYFGVNGRDISTDKDTIFSLVEEGTPIICSMHPGDFTAKGHFVVLTDIKDGKICLNDCMSKARSQTLWDWDRFEPQIHHAWAFTEMI